MDTKTCLKCSKAHVRPRSIFCSQRCSVTHKRETVAKLCEVCHEEYFSRGRTCSPQHALELKKRTNREKFGSDWAIQTEEAKAKRVKTNIEKYGVEHHLQSEESLAKLRETNMRLYGVPYVAQNPSVKEKQKATNLERYGEENPFASEQIKEKIKSVHMHKRGVEYPSHDPLVIEKMKRTNRQRYGTENQFQRKEIQERIREHYMETLGVPHHWLDEKAKDSYKKTSLERYGVDHPMKTEALQKKMAEIREESVRNGTAFAAVSKINRSMAEAIEKRYGFKVTLEKAVEGRSFDLHIEGTNILVEINPLISHNSHISYPCVFQSCEQPCAKHKPKEKSAHYQKAKIAKDNNFRLIQLYDWDSKEVLYHLLDGKLKKNFRRFSARKLTLKEVSVKEANDFLGENHIQGYVKAQKFRYGLWHDDELVAVATFGKSRFKSKFEYEWLRYAVKKGVIVHGAAGRMWEKFLLDVNPKSVISYVEYDHTTAPEIFLNALSFREQKPTGAKELWYNPKLKKKFASSSLYAIGADKLLGTAYGPRAVSGLDNRSIMLKEGFLPIYTAGNRVFIWEASEASL